MSVCEMRDVVVVVPGRFGGGEALSANPALQQLLFKILEVWEAGFHFPIRGLEEASPITGEDGEDLQLPAAPAVPSQVRHPDRT